MTVYLYILIAGIVTYLLRVLPMTLIRKPISNVFLRSFLSYLPYVTLSVMVFPEIILQTGKIWIGIVAFLVGVIVAWFKGNLFLVASSVCLVTFLLEILPV